MTQFDEQVHRSWQALNVGRDIGWDAAATDCLNIMYPEAQTHVDDETRTAKIAYVRDFVWQVVNAPLEPVIFYRPGSMQKVNDANMHLFSIITPNPDKPLDFMSPQTNEESKAVITLNPYSAKIGQLRNHQLYASFETTVNATPDSNVKVWYGAGTQSITVSPDQAYEERQTGTLVAVGSKATADLFTSLRTDDSVHNGRMFGAIFNVARVAQLLDTKPTLLGDYAEEKAAAVESIHVRRSGAQSIMRRAGIILDLIEQAETEASLQAKTIETTSDLYRESMGDVYIPDLYPSRSVADEILHPGNVPHGPFKNISDRQKYSIDLVQQAIESYDAQLAVLNTITN